MLSLTNEVIESLQYYFHLLETIKEGFDHILEEYFEIENIEEYYVFKDILVAFYHIDSSRGLLEETFKDDIHALHSIKKFDELIMLLDHGFSYYTSKEQLDFLAQQLVPAFLTWKETIQKYLKFYVLH